MQSKRFPLLGLLAQVLLTVLAVIIELVLMLGGKSSAPTPSRRTHVPGSPSTPRVH